MVDGVIKECGTYADLINHGGPFSKFVQEFTNGNELEDRDDEEKIGESTEPETSASSNGEKSSVMEEERFRGGVSWRSMYFLLPYFHACLFPLQRTVTIC